MKPLQFILYKSIFLLSLLLGSCSEDVKIPDYGDPNPTSINYIRRMELNEQLIFGTTAIRAVVTTDILAKNTPDNILVVQDLTSEAAIVLELNYVNKEIQLGDLVVLDLKGSRLEIINNELIISNIDQSAITIESTGNNIRTKSTNLASLMMNAKYWGPILVKVDKINIENSNDGLLAGNLLIDDEIVELRSQFLPGSVFHQETNPLYVEGLKGLARLDEEGVLLVPRNLDDLQVGLSELLEDFERSSNTDYNAKVMNFITGSWTIDGGITATSAADPKNGKQSIRLQGTIGNENRQGIIAMNFDLNGIKTINISHGIYPAAAEVANINPTTFRLEISHDQGKTYTSIGSAEIDTQSNSLMTTEFKIDAGFSQATRIRIVNSSLPFANGNKPRINIDDIHFTF